jgi:thiosulfate dehydrogenase
MSADLLDTARVDWSRNVARLRLGARLLLVTWIAAACTLSRESGVDTTRLAQSGASGADSSADDWQPPLVSDLPDDSLGSAVRRGLALFLHTPDSLPKYVGANLTCSSCHLDEGRRPTSAPVSGVFARYPRYLDRAGAVVSIEDRVNYCITRSLAGWRLPSESREMHDMVAYLAFMSRGAPVGVPGKSTAMPQMPKLTGDTTRGGQVYRASCARCHGADGSGVAKVPALWGAKSFSVGASMTREERAASFVRHNMPFDQPGTLTDQQAFDVAAYFIAKPRPDLPGKERDWPAGGAPFDVPYNTKGHRAHRPPTRLLPRRNPAQAVVTAPRPASR